MVPTVGRIVHYREAGGNVPLAAVVTASSTRTDPALSTEKLQEHNYNVSLKVLLTSGEVDIAEVPYSMTPTEGHWSWPPQYPR